MIVVFEHSFGAAVVDALSATLDVLAVPLDQAASHDFEKNSGGFVAFALGGSGYGRRMLGVADRLWQAGIPHSAAVLSDCLLTNGPLVAAPSGPCFRCVAKRALSMAEAPRTARIDQNLQLFLERNTARELHGHLPTLVQMSALRLRQHASLDPRWQGRISAVSFSNSRTVESVVLPLHGCPCRGERTGPRDATLRRLAQVVAGGN